MQILDAVTAVHPHLTDTVVVGLDDPELFEYPLAYMAEAGYSIMSDKQQKEYETTLEMNLAVGLPDSGRFRVNVYQAGGGDPPAGRPSSIRSSTSTRSTSSPSPTTWAGR